MKRSQGKSCRFSQNIFLTEITTLPFLSAEWKWQHVWIYCTSACFLQCMQLLCKHDFWQDSKENFGFLKNKKKWSCTLKAKVEHSCYNRLHVKWQSALQGWPRLKTQVWLVHKMWGFESADWFDRADKAKYVSVNRTGSKRRRDDRQRKRMRRNGAGC